MTGLRILILSLILLITGATIFTIRLSNRGEGEIPPPVEMEADLTLKNIRFVEADSRIRGDLIEAMAIDPSGRRLWVVIRNGNNNEAEGGCVAVVDIEQVVLRDRSWPGFHSIIDVIDLQPSEICQSSGSHECPQ